MKKCIISVIWNKDTQAYLCLMVWDESYNALQFLRKNEESSLPKIELACNKIKLQSLDYLVNVLFIPINPAMRNTRTEQVALLLYM